MGWEMSVQISVHADPAGSRAFSRDQVRLRIRHLDACLERLEGAHERGVVTVPVPLAMAIRRYVPAVAPGMAITHAIELVMREQEPHLACSAAARSEAPGRERITASAESGVEIDERGARELTDRIRAAAHNAHRLCSLLVEAHDVRAWAAIGYSTWSDYIRSEFRLSRSRSYELLDHGRVLRALEAATGLSGIPDITPYAATQIKPHLAEVTEAIRARTAGLPPESVARVADQVVWEVRSRHISERKAAQGAPGGSDVARLFEAVQILADMPDIPVTLKAILPSNAHHLERLDTATRWLDEFARAWRDGRQETTGTLVAAS
jgi:hypothetical protein